MTRILLPVLIKHENRKLPQHKERRNVFWKYLGACHGKVYDSSIV
jgi:hypothetical protein